MNDRDNHPSSGKHLSGHPLTGEELSPTLAAHAAAMASATPPPAALERAQQRLMRRLQARPGSARRPVGTRWMAAATAAVLALVAVMAVPLLPDGGAAFAAVQDHFRDFRTLSMRVEQRVGGRTLQTSHMVVNGDGVLRTDVGEQLSVIVDPVRGRLLTLLHGPRRAMAMPLDQAAASPDAALDWLEQIRQFQGRAERLPGTRSIDGREARGWSLEAEGTRLLLWADATGLPLAMDMAGGGGDAEGGLQLHYRFGFDAPVPAGHLSSEVPPGYTVAAPDRD